MSDQLSELKRVELRLKLSDQPPELKRVGVTEAEIARLTEAERAWLRLNSYTN